MNSNSATKKNRIQKTIFIFSFLFLLFLFTVIQENTSISEYKLLPPLQHYTSLIKTSWLYKYFTPALTTIPNKAATNSIINKNSEENSSKEKNNFLLAGKNNKYLHNFFQALKELKQDKRKIVRILHYGDSSIRIDNMSIQMKRKFQKDFGDGGRGLVALKDIPATILKDHKNLTKWGFKLYRIPFAHFSLKENLYLGFTGYSTLPLYKNSKAYYNLPEGLKEWENIQILLRNFYKEKEGQYQIELNSENEDDKISDYNINKKLTTKGKKYISPEFTVPKNECFSHSLKFNPTRKLALKISSQNKNKALIDGVILETGKGVSYSPVIQVGLHQAWMLSVPEENLSCGLKQFKPDLVIFQFAVNESESMRTHYGGFTLAKYKEQLNRYYKRIRKILPNTSILVFGTFERIRKKNGEYVIVKTQDKVRIVQENLAPKYKFAYFDLYNAFGGKGHSSMLKQKRLITSDFLHLLKKGRTKAVDLFYSNFISAYNNYIDSDTSAESSKQKLKIATKKKLIIKQALEATKQNESSAIIFNSISYFIFLLILLVFAGFLFRFPTFRVLFLLLASYYFYASWKLWPLLLILFSTFLDYFLAIGIEKRNDKNKGANFLLILSLIGNLGLLFIFKYLGFFSSLLNDLFSYNEITYQLPVYNLLLPVGISFYTFQTLSYTIDIYRGEMKTERNFLKFALYVAFFPQLVAGPIVRAKEFLPQLKKNISHFFVTYEKFSFGILLILVGLLKKLSADWIADNIVDNYYSNPTLYSTADAIVSFYAYGMQIYCDFSGYTDIAIGSANLLGFNLTKNFNRPYLSISISDFWRRWHISLGSWLRDYLYISLGGNRKRVYINLFITMFLAGLWHGARLNFLFWGLIHGFFLILERLFGFSKVQRKDLKPAYRFIATFLTFHIIIFSWIVFRVVNWQNIVDVYSSLSLLHFQFANTSTTIMGVILLFFFIHFSPPLWKKWLQEYWQKGSPLVHAFIAFLFTILFYRLYVADTNPFIYFQF